MLGKGGEGGELWDSGRGTNRKMARCSFDVRRSHEVLLMALSQTKCFVIIYSDAQQRLRATRSSLQRPVPRRSEVIWFDSACHMWFLRALSFDIDRERCQPSRSPGAAASLEAEASSSTAVDALDVEADVHVVADLSRISEVSPLRAWPVYTCALPKVRQPPGSPSPRFFLL
jgi:hypothetical protein